MLEGVERRRELDAGSGPLSSRARPYEKRESKGPKVPPCGILEVSKVPGHLLSAGRPDFGLK